MAAEVKNYVYELNEKQSKELEKQAKVSDKLLKEAEESVKKLVEKK